MAESDNQQSGVAYSEQGLWDKLRRVALQAGREVVEKVLMLYYAAQRPETPLWAKMVIYSSLAYFVLPADAIPDITPFVGYTDDLSALVSALAAVAMSITPEVKESARQKVQDWFGEDKGEPANYAQAEHPQAGDSIREIAID